MPHSSIQGADVPKPSRDAAPLAAFMRGWSLEATLPKPAEIEALKGTLAPGTEVYLSAIPAESHEHLVESSKHVRRAGFEPVPHVAARNYRDRAALDDMLARVRGEADVRRVLVIGGDRDQSAGPYTDALSVIQSGALQAHGIKAISIGSYPDGHPRIPDHVLARALADKLAAAESAAFDVNIVSQFCFDEDRIVAWIKRLRAQGFTGRIRVGLAGPANVTTLLKFAQRCGVRASAHGLMRNVGLALQALGRATPEEIVKSLANATASGESGAVAPHFYSFGGFLATVRWTLEAERVTTV
jgi:methylenetetrahydrofolate reductase (NADPH)